MKHNPRMAFFDGIADRWDGWEDLPVLRVRLLAGLDALGVTGAETVLDVGCGTGNLTLALLDRLSAAGRVAAVDLSPRMIETARTKTADPRVTWLATDARHLPLVDGAADRAICCSVWPHVDDPRSFAMELGRVLRPGGSLHVWHLSSRDHVNAVHAAAGGAIGGDVLPPAPQTARLLSEVGFEVLVAEEDTDHYLVTAARPRQG